MWWDSSKKGMSRSAINRLYIERCSEEGGLAGVPRDVPDKTTGSGIRQTDVSRLAAGLAAPVASLPSGSPLGDARHTLLERDEQELVYWIKLRGKYGDPPTRAEIEWVALEALYARSKLEAEVAL